jgi:hypothetical protein
VPPGVRSTGWIWPGPRTAGLRLGLATPPTPSLTGPHTPSHVKWAPTTMSVLRRATTVMHIPALPFIDGSTARGAETRRTMSGDGSTGAIDAQGGSKGAIDAQKGDSADARAAPLPCPPVAVHRPMMALVAATVTAGATAPVITVRPCVSIHNCLGVPVLVRAALPVGSDPRAAPVPTVGDTLTVPGGEFREMVEFGAVMTHLTEGTVAAHPAISLSLGPGAATAGGWDIGPEAVRGDGGRSSDNGELRQQLAALIGGETVARLVEEAKLPPIDGSRAWSEPFAWMLPNEDAGDGGRSSGGLRSTGSSGKIVTEGSGGGSSGGGSSGGGSSGGGSTSTGGDAPPSAPPSPSSASTRSSARAGRKPRSGSGGLGRAIVPLPHSDGTHSLVMVTATRGSEGCIRITLSAVGVRELVRVDNYTGLPLSACLSSWPEDITVPPARGVALAWGEPAEGAGLFDQVVCGFFFFFFFITNPTQHNLTP